MRSLSPKVRAMLGVMSVFVYAGLAVVSFESWPLVAAVCAGLALLRVVLLFRQWRRSEG